MKHLLDTKYLTLEEMQEILERASFWEKRENQHSSSFANRFVANLFLEPSTRTRFSFEVAEKRLGLHVLQFSPDTSSITKGESLYDTVQTLAAMGVDAVVLRHQSDTAIMELAKQEVRCALLNAGAGRAAHPTQALLDLYTMVKHFDKDLTGLTVGIVGDIKHSRVVRSNLWTLKAFGANVYVSGPEEMRDSEVEQIAPYKLFDRLVCEADVLMMLRVQLERHQENLFGGAESYHQAYGLTVERQRRMKKDAIILHPAPVNRGVEIADELVEHPKSKIFEQVTNGVVIRMAVLERALTGGTDR
jgi:aspartate carbamoyltransferase catalytic subunit